MVSTAYSAYKDNSVLTASSQELTLMLYEGAIKFCNIAIMAIEQKDIQKANTNILKVERIIEEFQASLDMRYDLSNELALLYDYIYRRLVEANLSKDIAILDEVLEFLRTLRDTWKEAMKISKNQFNK